MPVAAGVVRDLRMAARCVLAARDMAAECRRATALDRPHHLQLLKAHMGAVGLTPGKAVIAEDIRDLQSWSSHGRWRYGAGGSSLSRFARRRRGALRSSSGPSSQAWNVRARPESRECPCRARADGSRSCGEANAAAPSCEAPRLWRPP